MTMIIFTCLYSMSMIYLMRRLCWSEHQRRDISWHCQSCWTLSSPGLSWLRSHCSVCHIQFVLGLKRNIYEQLRRIFSTWTRDAGRTKRYIISVLGWARLDLGMNKNIIWCFFRYFRNLPHCTLNQDFWTLLISCTSWELCVVWRESVLEVWSLSCIHHKWECLHQLETRLKIVLIKYFCHQHNSEGSETKQS